MASAYPELSFYPSPAAVDQWLDEIWEAAGNMPCEVEETANKGYAAQLSMHHLKGCGYVRFKPAGGEVFYGYWQPPPSGPAPLLIHLPGYGAEISVHPDLVSEGYAVLHVNPLGYATPAGYQDDKRRGADWPVLPDTVHTAGREGYRQWLIQCVLATRWAQRQAICAPDRVSFFGTSQGGGAALLLASLYRGRGARCAAADEPFLTHFPMALAARGSHAYEIAAAALSAMPDPGQGWYGLGLVDTLSHARRLTLPVLLTAASKDRVCPADTVKALFERLPDTRAFCFLNGVSHCYTGEFVRLASAWFRLYA